MSPMEQSDGGADQVRTGAIAGFATGMFSVPEGMAYAQLAGVPPVYGLYSGVVATFVAALTTRTVLMISTLTASISLTTGSILESADIVGDDVPGALFMITLLTGGVMLARPPRRRRRPTRGRPTSAGSTRRDARTGARRDRRRRPIVPDCRRRKHVGCRGTGTGSAARRLECVSCRGVREQQVCPVLDRAGARSRVPDPMDCRGAAGDDGGTGVRDPGPTERRDRRRRRTPHSVAAQSPIGSGHSGLEAGSTAVRRTVASSLRLTLGTTIRCRQR
jgi:hypothetical protein